MKLVKKIAVLLLAFGGMCPVMAQTEGVSRIRIVGAEAGDTLILTEIDRIGVVAQEDTLVVLPQQVDTFALPIDRTGRLFDVSFRTKDGRQGDVAVFSEEGVEYTIDLEPQAAALRAGLSGGLYDSSEMRSIVALEDSLSRLGDRIRLSDGQEDSLVSLWEKTRRELVYAQERFIVYHPENGFSAYLVSELLRRIPEETSLERVRRLYNSLNGGARNTHAGEVANEEIYASLAASEGASVPRLTFASPQGEPVSPSHYRGKWVALDFWSPDEPSSRRDLPQWERAYEQYRDKGLEVISIAVCHPQTYQTHQAEPQDSLPWAQAYVSRTFDGSPDVVSLFALYSFPTAMLIDPEGKIAFRGRPAGLFAKLEEVFATPQTE